MYISEVTNIKLLLIKTANYGLIVVVEFLIKAHCEFNLSISVLVKRFVI